MNGKQLTKTTRLATSSGISINSTINWREATVEVLGGAEDTINSVDKCDNRLTLIDWRANADLSAASMNKWVTGENSKVKFAPSYSESMKHHQHTGTGLVGHDWAWQYKLLWETMAQQRSIRRPTFQEIIYHCRDAHCALPQRRKRPAWYPGKTTTDHGITLMESKWGSRHTQPWFENVHGIPRSCKANLVPFRKANHFIITGPKSAPRDHN